MKNLENMKGSEVWV